MTGGQAIVRREASDKGVNDRQHLVGVCVIAAAVLWPAVVIQGRVLLTQDEALRLAFGPDARVERVTAFLSDEQLEEVARLTGAGATRAIAMVPHYVAWDGADAIGVAYFDTHRVRTEAETIMVVLGTHNDVLRVEVVAFDEPPDYLPRPAWLRQFDGRSLDDELALRRAIRPMTGASLTAEAITMAVRRALALHAVIVPLPTGGERQGPAGNQP